jgi:uncharacterized protein (UPF0264 family)
MRLLVSVRAAAEVAPAIRGGADIVDAKEPSHGPLGPVSGAELRAIAACVPAEMPLSVALGDPADASGLEVAMAVLDGVGPRRGPTYIKIGLSAAGAGAEALLRAAVGAAAGAALRPSVVAVGYADHLAARAPAPDAVLRLALAAGASGVLLDTWDKGSGDLFHHVAESELAAWVADARGAGLLVALAGSLTLDGVRLAATLGADIVGVRGAACDGGREGALAAGRVSQLRAAMAPGSAAAGGAYRAPVAAS